LRRVSRIRIVPVAELHVVPSPSLDCCGTSRAGRPSRAPVAVSVTIFQPALLRVFRAAAVSAPRSCGLSTPVCLPP